LLEEHGDAAALLSGGTDLVPNLKLAQESAEVLISLQNLDELEGVRREGDQLCIGARTRLVDVASHPDIERTLPVLTQAVHRIASPQIRNMGTLGGNLCLDTRCRYINQSELFRQALGGCLKSHGAECHVVPGGPGCVAALSADSVPPLIALKAQVVLVGSNGSRTLALKDFYNSDGLKHTNIEAGEILAEIRIPTPPATSRFTYRKWAVRKSIDFPLISMAIRLDLSDDEGPDNEPKLMDGCLVVGALGPKPKTVPLAAFAGSRIDEGLAKALGELVKKRCKPLPNIPYDPAYRRTRLGVEVKRGVLSLAEGG
jgi:4-hydroxybenzoyl-CoA reductase subunit beta